MKLRLLASALLATLAANAQITITSSDMPFADDTIRYSTSSTNVSSFLNDSGANRTWNIGSLVPDFQDMASYKTPVKINAAFLITFSASDYGTEDDNISFGAAASATEVYRFYKNNPGSYVADGRGFSIQASPLPLTQTYSGKDVVYRFPLTYGNRDSNSYISNTASLGTVSVISKGKRINTVDGWGSLTTPYGTFNCIRVKSVFHGLDSIVLSGFPLTNLPRNYTEYKWLATGKKIPLLEITVQGSGGTTIKYRDINRPEVFKTLATFSANKTSFAANSTDTCILNDQSANNPKSVQWTITPNTYTFVGGTSASSKQPKVFFSKAGNYTITLKATYNAGTDDTTRTGYIQVTAPPIAQFSASTTLTDTSTVVSFHDSSTGNPMPTQWQWTFTPNTVRYYKDSTSATSQNPKVIFSGFGSYTVSLKVTNSSGSDSITKTSYISIVHTGINEVNGQQDHIQIYPNPAGHEFNVTADRSVVSHIDMADVTGKIYPVSYNWIDNNTCTVDCQALNAGIYFVNVHYTDKQTLVKKISIK